MASWHTNDVRHQPPLGNANQNHNATPVHTRQGSLLSGTWKAPSTGWMQEAGTLAHGCWE